MKPLHSYWCRHLTIMQEIINITEKLTRNKYQSHLILDKLFSGHLESPSWALNTIKNKFKPTMRVVQLNMKPLLIMIQNMFQ